MKMTIKKSACLLLAIVFCCLSVACQPTTDNPAVTTTTPVIQEVKVYIDDVRFSDFDSKVIVLLRSQTGSTTKSIT